MQSERDELQSKVSSSHTDCWCCCFFPRHLHREKQQGRTISATGDKTKDVFETATSQTIDWVQFRGHQNTNTRVLGVAQLFSPSPFTVILLSPQHRGKRIMDACPVGFGAATLGQVFGKVSQETADAAVDAALAGGVRLFDTSAYYGAGQSERMLGRSLCQRP